MFKRTKVSLAVATVISGLGLIASNAYAQTEQRVEITGSAIKRIDAEGALPVQVFTKEDIVRSGVTSAVDLVRKLPSIQGSTGESASVGGSTFGFSGISVHNVGETRTLVLLNGHRLTQFGGQTLTGFAAAFDLNSLPLSAIERVEVLTDGASALYGADAIAGVVNFITKRNTTDGDFTVGLSEPKGGAKEKRFSITKGFGTQEANGFNGFFSYTHETRTPLQSTQRDFAKTGRVLFSQGGKQYRFQQFSASPIPANATDNVDQLISPYQKVNGSCPDKTFRVIEPYEDTDGTPRVNDYCGFDFVGELEIYPVRKRDSGIFSLTKAIGDHELFADLLYSESSQTSRIAPVPGGISIPAGSPLHDKYLLPVGITGDSTAFYRVYDLGKRTESDTARFLDIALGSRGQFIGWDYNAAYGHSTSDAKSSISGYPGAKALAGVRASGLLDPFVGPGQQSAAGLAALNAVNFNGYWDGGTATLDTLTLRGSREIATLPGGPVQLGTGLNFNREKFQSKPSLFAQGLLADPVAGTLCDPATPSTCDQRFGDSSQSVPYTASRNSYGLFGELIIPVIKHLETSFSLRYDHYSDFGSATTAKGSFRWTPVSNLLIRGSVGSGFHAPTVPQVAASQRPYGVTSDKYPCPADLRDIATSLGAVCQPGNRQYDQLAAGNPELKPEKSIQGTLGIRFEPIPEVSLGVDLWHVGIKDLFGTLPEQAVFANPKAFPSSWGTNLDVGTGTTYLAFKNINQNLGKWYSTGLDFDFSAKAKSSWGIVSSQLTLTYMLREDQQIEKGGAYYSAIGVNSPELGVVTFRYQGRWATSLKTGDWTNTLGVNFKSGYTDQEQTVDVLDASGNVVGSEDIKLHIDTYATVDWQTAWSVTKDVELSLGLLNIFDTKPPFTLSTSGTNKGQQFGYDDRYYDPRGRTFYANLTYRF